MKRKWANILIVGSMIAIIVLLSVIYIPAKVEANENKREQADMELLQKVKVAFESVLENDEAKVSFDLLKKWDVPVYNAVTDNLADGQVFQAAVNGNTEVSLYVYYDKELNVKVQFVNNSTGDIVKGKYINKEMEIV